jgi:hypothetical protein
MSTVSTTVNHGITLGSGGYTSPLTITNTGAINNNGIGPAVFGGVGTVVNDGHITAAAKTTVFLGTTTVLAAYSGVYLTDAGSYLNNSGTIRASLYGVQFQSGGSITNSGVVYGAKWGVTSRGPITVANTGTISAGNHGINLGGGGFVDNGGLISGPDALGIGGVAGTVDNTGTITGYSEGVGLGAGGTISNASTGLISVTGASYAALYVGNKYYSTTAQGVVTNAGTLIGDIGVSFYATETLSQTLIDTGTIIGTGGTAIAFSAGNDLLRFDPSTSIHIEGVVDGGGGTNTVAFASGATTGTLTGTGVTFVNFANITIDSGATWVFAGSNTVGANTTLTDSGSLTVAGTLTNDGLIGVSPPIAVTGTFVNAGTLSLTSGTYIVQLAPGGYFLNTTAGVVAKTIGGSTYAPAIYGTTGGASRVVNLGTISNSHFNVGVKLNAGGTVTNGATNATSALIYGGFPVLIQGGSGTVNNFGTLRSVATFGGSGVTLGAGGVVNNGIAGSTAALIVGDNYGVRLDDGGTVNNFGTITALKTAGVRLFLDGLVNNEAGATISGYTGVYATTEIATVVNMGTITGSAGYGIRFAEGGTVTDAGSISGSTEAVVFDGANAGLLILERGYSLHGVRGSTSASATVELLGTSTGNAVTVSYNGLGLTSVGTIAFAPTTTNFATLKISNDATLPGTITNFTGAHDTIDLTTLGFVSGGSTATFNNATDKLTVSNGTNAVTLQLGSGTYTSVGFTAVSDGATGTDITVGPAALTYAWIGGSADWRTATNWSSGIIPGTTANATIANAGSNTVFITPAENIVVAELTLSNADTLLVEGTFAPTGAIDVAGALLSIASTGMVTNAGTLTDSGTVTVSGTLVNDGVVTASTEALVLGTGGQVSNKSGAVITASGTSGIGVYGAGLGTVTNAGSIVSAGTSGFGIRFNAGGLVTNTSGGAIVGDTGVFIGGGTGTVRNAAYIHGTAAAGVQIAGGGTITNQSGGTIKGTTDAVTFAASFTNRLVIDPGAVFSGTVNGGNTIGAASTSTLELASAASDGTLSGLGSQYADFAQILVDTHAQWDLAGTNTAAHGVTLTDNGTLTVNGTLLNAGLIVGDYVAIAVGTGGQFTNQSGGTITNANPLGILLTGAGTVVNAGLVQLGTSGGQRAVYLDAGGVVTNQSGGTIIGNGGIYAINVAATVVNEGAILSPASVTSGSGVVLDAGGLVSNASGGSITGYTAIYFSGGAGTLINAGKIVADTLTYAYGVKLGDGGSVTNQSGGTISGNDGVTAIGTATVTNLGSIGGSGNYGIDLEAGGTVINAGRVSGAAFSVVLGSGHTNRLVVDPGAVFVGGVDGGNTIGATSISTLELASGASAGTLSGFGSQFTDFAQTTIDAGAQWTLTGSTTLVSGATLTDSGSLTASGTFTNNGSIVADPPITVIGTFINNSIVSAPGTYTAFAIADGGALTNTTSGRITAGDDAITAAGTVAITNLGTISGTTSAGIALAAGTIVNGAASGATALISGATGSGIEASDATTVTNLASGVISGVDGFLANGQASVVNAGTIGGRTTSGSGIFLAAGGQVSNQSGGLISGLFGIFGQTDADTIVNSGTIEGSVGTNGLGVALNAGGTLSNQSGGLITAKYAVVSQLQPSTVVNAGTITGATLAGNGVEITGGGLVSNQSGGVISAAYGVILSVSAATVVNAGLISSSSRGASGEAVDAGAGGAITNQSGGTLAASLGIVGNGSALSVVNAGSIVASTTGISLAAGGVVSNQAGGIIDGATGLLATGRAVTVVNAGSIAGTNGIGVSLAAGGTIIDSGRIQGSGTAVALGGTAGNLVILEQGYTLSGAVVGSASASNTLELLGSSAANAVLANYNSLALTNFRTIAFAPTATNYATLNIGNDATLPGTITNFTGAHDTIDLTTLTFVSGSSTAVFDSASDRLTVSNGTTSVTLQLGSGSYGSVGFTAASDGATGTDITIGPAAATYAWIGGSADWRTATNWSSGIIPGTAVIATIANAGSNTVTIGSAESIVVAGLTLSNADTLLVEGTFAPTGAIGVTGALLSIASTGMVTNAGTLTDSGTVTVSGTLVNDGVVTASTEALVLGTGGRISNHSGAVITATGSGGIGVYGAGLGTVTNAGSIGGSAIGVQLARGGTVVNASGGIISGGTYAVKLAAGYTERLVIDPGATFSGVVAGGNGAGGSASSTLELASGAGTGTLTSLASSFQSFGTYVVDVGARWALAGSNTIQPGYTLTNNGTLTILGTLSVYGTVLDAGTILNDIMLAAPDGVVSVGPTGVITAGGTGPAAIYGVHGGTVVNLGTITNTSASGSGVSLDGGGSVSNGGTITAASGVLITGGIGTVTDGGTIFGSSGVAVSLAAGGYVDIGAAATGSSGVVITGGAGTVSNGGTILATSGAGVSLGSGGSFSNGGYVTGASGVVVTGGYAIISNGETIIGTSGAAITLADGGSISNGGQVTGAAGIVITGAAGTLSNGATIVGTGGVGVSLGAGGSVSNGFLITGTSTGVTISGGAGTVQNGGTISGTLGVAFSGTYNDTLQDGGTIIGTGGTAVSFGGGNDLLRFNPGAGAKIQGTVNGGGGTNALEFASASVAGTLTGVGAYFTNFTTGTVDAGARWVLAGSNTFANGLTLTDAGTLTISGSLANAGSIAVDPPLYVSGTLVNSNTISAVLANPAEVAVSVVSGGVLTNSGTGAIIGGAATPNLNNVTPVDGYTGGNGVDVSGGSVTNQARITGGVGGRTAYGYAVAYYGGAGGVGVALTTGSLSNAAVGIISGGSGGYGGYGGGVGGSGVVLATGSLSNQGTILGGAGGAGPGQAGGGGSGVDITSAGQVVSNQGTIRGGAAGPDAIRGATGGVGVYFATGGTLIDAGLIGGGAGSGAYGTAAAVQFQGTASDLLILEHGYTLHGAVVGSTSASATNTLELLGTSSAASVTATYNSLGLTHVGTIAFAPTATNYATLKITNDATLPGTITNFTGAHDTIDLTTLAFVSGSSIATFDTASDKLTVSNGTNVVTLQLGSGTYSSVGFTAVSDGATGTDIIVGPAPLTYSWIGGSADWRTATNWSSGVIPGTSAVATISNAGSNVVTISSSESISVTGLTLSNHNTLDVLGTFAPSGDVTVTGARLYLESTGSVIIAATLTNSGTVFSDKYGLRLANGGDLLNQAGGFITLTSGSGTAGAAVYGQPSATATVTNFGTISAPRPHYNGIILASGTVINASAATIDVNTGEAIYIKTGTGTVNNDGMITGDGSSVIQLQAGGYVSNGSLGVVGGTSLGVLISGGGTIFNQGSITSNDNGVRILGGGTVINQHAIIGFGGAGVSISGGGTVINQGTIEGLGTTGAIYISGGGTVIDSGTMYGIGTAVIFSGGTSNLLVLEHGYHLTGSVYGSVSASNVLELLGTSSANSVVVKYNSLGLTHVGTIAFAPTATNYATLQITNDATLPGTIARFTGAHDTVDLTTLAYVSGSSSALFNTASDKLTVTNGTNAVTLQLGSGSYSNVGFRVTSDGATGTDIIAGSALTYAWIGGSADWRTATNWSSGVIPGAIANATIANAGSNTVTISSSESIVVAGVTLSNSNTLDVAGTLAPTEAISISSALLSISAGGLISHGGNGTLISGTGTVSNDGTIAGGNHYGINLTGTVSNQGSIGATVNATTIVNRGTISNTTSYSTGVVGTYGTFVEIINGTSGATSALIAGASTGVRLIGGSGGGTVLNYGTVIGTNFEGVDLFASAGTVGLSNYGTILAGGSGLAYAAVHVGSAATIKNSGVIEETAADTAGVYVRSNPGVTNIGLNLDNSGLITAAGNAVVVNSAIPAVVTNSGTLIGSEGFSVFSTVATSQTLIDSGTIIGTSGTAVGLGSGNDLLQFQPSASVFVQGTVDGGAGTNTLEFASGATAGTLTGAGADFVDFGNGMVDAGAAWTLAGGVTLGSTVTLTDSGTLTDAETVTNGGTIVDVGRYALQLANGAYLLNQAGGVITASSGYAVYGQASATATLANFGTIAATGARYDGVRIAGGTVINGSSATTTALIHGYSNGVYIQTGTGTVTNAGSISGGNNEGVYLHDGGVVSNTGSGTISGGNAGVVVSGNGAVDNQGTIAGANDAVFITGVGTVVNQGAIRAGNAFGVLIEGAGAVNNQGTILGTRSTGVKIEGNGSLGNSGVITGRYGVVLLDGGTVANYATITGLTYSGVAISGGGTVIDAGTISGASTAVAFYGTYNNLLVLRRGYALHGAVYGSSGASSAVELLGTSAANAVTATYNSLGLTNFGTIGFASGNGNYATLKITNDATLPGTITNFTGAHDTIDLTSLAFVSGSSSAFLNTATDKLTVSNGASSVTLQLGSGNYSGVGFTAVSDGATGTDITVGPAVLTYSWIGGSGDWRTATHWSSGIVPGTTASATIANAGSNTVTIGSAESIAVAGLTLSNQDTLLVAGTFAPTGAVGITSALLSIASGGRVTNATTLTDNGTLVDAGTLINTGSLVAGSQVTVSGTFINSNIVSAPGTYAAFSLAPGGVLTNTASGIVTAAYNGVIGGGGAASVVNLGSILSNTNTFDYGISLGAGGTITNGAAGTTTALISGYVGAEIASGLINNYATISGSGTNGGYHLIYAALLRGAGQISNHAGGLITGYDGIGLLGASATATNLGEVSAANVAVIAYHDGDSIINGTSAGSPALIAGTGRYGVSQAIYSGLASETLVNDGTITGKDGVGDQVTGLNGTLHATIVDAGTIIGTSGTAIAAFDGGGGVSLTLKFTTGNAFIQGTVVGENGGTGILEFTSGASAGTLTGSNADFTNFQTASVDAGADWTLAGTNTLGSGVGLVDAGTLTNSGTLVIDPPLTVTGTFINSSIVSAIGGGDAIYVANGGVVTNTVGGTITGGTVAITAAGTATIDNFGIVAATSTFAAIAIGSGTVINGGASNTTAAILGSTYGIEASGVATVVNYGTVTANHQEGIGLRAGGSLDNFGVIDANEYGVFLYGPGTATNSGTIIGSGGIVTNYADNVVINSGDITGTRGGGIILQAGGTVIDSGTISAGYFAVLFRGTVNNLLVLENGYKITGPVGGSATASSNVVELLGTSVANAVTANYNGLGLTRFGTIAFAPTATNYATLKISNDATLPGTITNFTGTHDTIDLTTLAFVSGSSTATFNTATDRLIVSNGTNAVTLQLGSGSYSGIGFTAVSDGATGTDITVGAAALTYSWIGGSADWRTATNWSSGIIPGTTASATIANAGSNTVTISSAESIQVANLTLANADTLLVGGTFAPTGAIGVTGALLSIGSGGTVTNFGTFTDAGTVANAGLVSAASGNGLTLAAGGLLSNTGTIIAGGDAVTAAGVVDLDNLGTIRGTTLAGLAVGSGTIINGASGTTTAQISGGSWGVHATDATVVNYGQITGAGIAAVFLQTGAVTNMAGATLSGADAVYVGSGTATVVNAGSMTSGTGGVGVNLRAGGLVTNQSGGTISGDIFGVLITGAAGTGTNAGSISASVPDDGGAVILVDGGSFTNLASGVISGYRGFEGVGAPTTVTNAGTIVGDSAVNTGIGVAFFCAGTLTAESGGTISGGFAAVQFTAGYNGRLVIDPDAVFIGKVAGGNTAGGTAVTTLELASGTAAGTLSGLGSKYTGFVQSTIDAGATWTLTGGNTIDAGYTFVDAGALTNAGSLVGNGGLGVVSGVTFSNTGTMTGAGTLTVGGTLTNAGTISFNGAASGDAVQLKLTSGASLINLSGATIGLVNADYQAVSPIIYGTGGPATVTNLGTIHHGEVGVSLSGGGQVVNGATNNTTALIAAYDGVLSGLASVTVANDGTISAGHIGVGMGGTGVVINGATNATAALLTGEDGAVFYGRAGTVINYGTILGTTHSSVIFTDGVFMGYGSGGTVIDAGTIAGSLYSVDFETSPTPGRYGPDGNNLLKLLPGADLIGKVTAAGTSNVLELASGAGIGTIAAIGTSFLGLGTITVDAGASWSLTGTSTLASSYTLTDSGTLDTSGTLTLTGTLHDNARLINDGSINVAGYAALQIGPGGYLRNDTTGLITRGPLGNSSFNAAVIGLSSGPVTVVNYGTIRNPNGDVGVYLRGGGIVTNGATNVTTALISGTVALYVRGSATVDNFATIVGSIGAHLYNGGTFTNGASNSTAALVSASLYGVLLDHSGTFTNFGTVIGSAGYGLQTGNGGTATNAGTISGAGGIVAAVGTLAVTNTGSIIGTSGAGVQLVAAGTITNTGSAALISGNTDGISAAGALTLTNSGTIAGAHAGVFDHVFGTVTNAGRITASATGTNAAGIYLFAGGFVGNQSGGTISGWDAGIVNGAAGTVVNAGLISANIANSPSLSGYVPSGVYFHGGTLTNLLGGTITGYVGARFKGGAGSVLNAGSIGGGTGGHAVGVELGAGGSLTNQSGGTITGHYGVAALTGATTVVNAGDIAGATDGIYLASGGMVIDSGTISGQTLAIGFEGPSASNLVVLEHGYALTGAVLGAAGSTNTLELLGTSAANAVTANYNTLGLTNFGTVAFAPSAGNYATLKITNDATLPATITNFSGFHDTIDLTGLSDAGDNAYTSFNTITRRLTVTSDGTSLTLQLGSGSYSGLYWAAQSDGNGGTNITPTNALPPLISGVVAQQGVVQSGTIQPFSSVTMQDRGGDGTITATVTLSSTANGTLSNLGGGNYDSGTGVYSFTGTSAAATTAIEGLVFTPASSASGVYVTTTGFTIGATGLGGHDSSTSSVTAVQQVLGLATIPASDIVFSISPDGSSFVAPTNGKTNEAVVTAPTSGGTYDLPTGYQAEFLGGTTSAVLIDTDVGNAVLVGNSGADTISAAFVANDSIVGGNGSNDIFAGTGMIAVVVGNGDNQITAPNGATYSVSLGNGADTVYADGGGTINGGTGGDLFDIGSSGGTNVVNSSGADTVITAGALTRVSLAGNGALLEGDGSGTVNVTVGGAADSIVASGASVNATTSGSDGIYYGGGSALDVIDNGTNNTVVAASGSVTVSAANSSPFVFGGSGNLLVMGGAGTPTVVGGSGAASIEGGSGGVVVAGGSGTPTVSGAASLHGNAGGMIDYVGSVGGAVFSDDAGTGATTLNAAGSSTGNLIYGSPDAGNSLVVIGGTGTDTIVAGPGATTVEASGRDAVGATSGSLRFIGGAESSTVFGGSGTASISGGSGGVIYAAGDGSATLDGVVTAFGSNGSVTDYVGANGSLGFFAGAGSETVNASAATANTTLVGGAAAGSQDVMLGGSGNDTLIAGTGADTLGGGGGSNQFAIIDGRAGGNVVITDFNSQDVVALYSYGASAASTALQGAQSTGGNTTITLSDNTTITFLGVSSASELHGHIFST